MPTLLQIGATPHQNGTSQTRRLADAFLDAWLTVHPAGVVETLDLSALELPSLDEPMVSVLFDQPSTAAPDQLARGHLAAYICDFPTRAGKDHPKVVALPHLGASTGEAEENCAMMVADTLRDFLEHGNVRNSVNVPEAVLPRVGGNRVAIANENVPNMVGQISTCLAEANLNIADLHNKSRGELAYTLIDTDSAVPAAVIGRIGAIAGVLSARLV